MLYNIWVVMIVCSALLFLLSLTLIFVFKVPDLLDELSGRKAKRQIKRLKELNIGTGTIDNLSTDDVYAAIPSGSLLLDEVPVVSSVNTDLAKNIVQGDDDIGSTTVMDGEETSYMSESDATSILNGVREFCENRVCIEIIEEQTSL